MSNTTNGFLSEGTEEGSNNNTRWLNLTRGAMVERVPEGTTGAKERTNQLGNQVFEKFYNRIGGKIKYLWTQEGKYNKQIILNFELGEDSVNVTMNIDSSYARSFFKQIFNVDFTKPIILTPYSFESEGKKIIGVSLKQNNVKVEKSLPENTPEVEFKESKNGKFIVNQIQQEERLEFLENTLIKLTEDNNLVPPTEWFKTDDTEVSDEDMKELERVKKTAKKAGIHNLDTDDDFDFEI